MPSKKNTTTPGVAAPGAAPAASKPARIRIFRTDPPPRAEVGSVAAGVGTLDVCGLAAGDYQFVAVAEDAAGNTSADSNTATVTIAKPPPNFVNAVKSLHLTANASADSKATVTLAWAWEQGTGQTRARQKVRYRVHGTEAWTDGPAIAADADQVTITPLAAGTSYDFELTVTGDAGATAAATLTEATHTETIAPVTNLKATGHTETSITVGWDWAKGTGDTADDFEIYIRLAGSSEERTLAATVGKDDRTATVSKIGNDPLTPDTAYEISVIAKAADGVTVSTYTTITDRTLARSAPGAPKDPRVTEAGDPGLEHHIGFEWSAPDTGEVSIYDYEWSHTWDGRDTAGAAQSGSSNTTSGMGILNAGSCSTYTLRVRAVGPTGLKSAWSEATPLKAKCQPTPDKPAVLKASSSGGTVTVSWLQLTDAAVPTKYEIQHTNGTDWEPDPAAEVPFVRDQLSYSTTTPSGGAIKVRVRAVAGAVAGSWSEADVN